MVIAGLSFVQLRGQPEKIGDRYLPADHGTRTEIDDDEYVELRKHDVRVAVGTPGAFAVTVLGAGLGYRNRPVRATLPGHVPYAGPAVPLNDPGRPEEPPGPDDPWQPPPGPAGPLRWPPA